MPDAPTYTTVRGLLRILERKGHIRHTADGSRFIYAPVLPKAKAGPPALAQVIRTFFDGSPSEAMAALLGSRARLPDEELRRMARLLEQARKGRTDAG